MRNPGIVQRAVTVTVVPVRKLVEVTVRVEKEVLHNVSFLPYSFLSSFLLVSDFTFTIIELSTSVESPLRLKTNRIIVFIAKGDFD